MIIESFEKCVWKYENKIAIKTFEKSLTFGELNNLANYLARKILMLDNKKNHKGNSQTIALLFDHGIDMIIALLASLKACKTYVPLDSKYPEKRLEYMTEHSEAHIIMTDNKNIGIAEKLVNSVEREIIILNIENMEENISSDNLKLEISEDQITYLLYTSGSTGKPKVVMQNHRNVLHFIDQYTKNLNVTSNDNMTLFSSFSHDAAVMDIYGALLNGATLFPRDIREDANLALLTQWIKEEKISIWHSVPTLYRYFLNTLKGSENFTELKYIVLGGEAILEHDIDMFNKLFSKTILYNLYGQSESSYNSGQYIFPKTQANKITLGNFVEGTELIVINEEGQRAERFETGEILVVSNHIALGYWKDSKKTSKAFLYSDELGKIYRTGDVGRVNYDGSIRYIGRMDNQVKIRGYRVELGEIESSLLNNEEIKEAVVIAKEDIDQDKCLYAYIISNRKLNVTKLRKYLLEQLPDYMIPSYFMQLEKMPLTPNGKIDRKALSVFDRSMPIGVKYEAPRNETEAILVETWKEVLKVDRIGINDNFFELGGHSLKATSLIAKIHKKINVEVPLREIFTKATIKELAEYINSLEENIYSSIQPVEKREYYPLSSAQKRLYALQRFNLDEINYNMSKVITLEGIVNKDRIEKVLDKLIKRHEILRTSFELIDGEPVQQIHDEIAFKIDYLEVCEKNVKEILKEFISPFDFSKAPLMRVGLIKLSEDKHILIFDMHHIISDGTSMGILIKEFTEIYKGEEHTKLKIQYKDYAIWQREVLGSNLKKQEEYWVEKFNGEIPVLNMPTDYLRPSIRSFEGDIVDFRLNKELTSGLKNIAKETGTTIYIVLLAGYNVLMSKYSGQEDIVVGSPIAGRSHADLENIIGMFVNMLVMRNFPKGNKTFREFLEEVKQTALQAYENQDYQFEELVEKLNVRRDMSRNPLFDIMFVLQNIDVESNELDGLKVNPYNYEKKTSRFDMTLNAVELRGKIEFNIEYCTKIFRRDTIERLSRHFINILQNIVEDVEVKVSEIQMMSEEEKRQILHHFNCTKGDYPKEGTIQQLFEQQVKKTPNNIALIYENKMLTYRELNEKSNSLARILKEKKVKPDNLVGIMVDRSLEMVIGILAVLKAGGAYLPIDPEYPEDRISYMLSDSNTETLLIQGELSNNIDFEGETINLVDDDIYKYNCSNLEVVNKPQDLAYVIYTSGSTGKPKGVMIEHRNVCNFVMGMTNKIDFLSTKTILALTTICFDIFFLETILPLTKGMKVVIASKEQQKYRELLEQTIIKNNIDMLQITPSRLKLLISNENGLLSLRKIKELMVGGEEFPKKLFDNIRSNLQLKTKIYNLFGPTETTIWSMLKDLTGEEEITIGKPIVNTEILIVDKDNNLQPIGLPGELCISGEGVGRGYINKPELTNEKFVVNPFESDKKMYRTGDLARWLPDGNVDFLGRIDKQVKIRGYRIELEEIEKQLLWYGEIKEVVVTAREDKNENKYLCAYLVSEREYTISELRNYLSKELPEYMIPSYFIYMERMPLTLNGKLDSKALPKPDVNLYSRVKYLAPRNEVEKNVVKIWKEILATEGEIGIENNFFDLGGHSLSLIKLIDMIAKEVKISLSVQDIYSNPTIRQISEVIKNKKENSNVFFEIQLELEDKILTECYIKNYKVGSKNYIVLYTDNYVDDIILLIKNQFSKMHLPHYIRPLINLNKKYVEDKFDNKLEFLTQIGIESSLTNETKKDKFLKEISKTIDLQASNIESSMTSGEIIDKYECLHFHYQYIEKEYAHYLLLDIEVNDVSDPNDIKLTLLQLINNTPLLRSKILKEKSEFYFIEFDCLKTLELSVIDIPNYCEIGYNLITDFIISSYNNRQFYIVDKFNDTLYKMIVFRKNRRDFQIIFYVDHVIFDGASKHILKKRFWQYYSSIVERKELQQEKTTKMSYKSYIESVNNSTNMIKLKRYVSSDYFLRLEEAVRIFKRTYSKNENSLIISEPEFFEYNFDLTSDYKAIDEKNSEAIALWLAVNVIEDIFKCKEIVMKVMCNMRSYWRDDCLNTIGDFHTSIPVIFEINQNNSLDYYNELNDIKSKHYVKEKIYIENMIYNNYYKHTPESKRIVNLLEDIPFAFNFIGELKENENYTIKKKIRGNKNRYRITGYTKKNKICLVVRNGVPKDRLNYIRNLDTKLKKMNIFSKVSNDKKITNN